VVRLRAFLALVCACEFVCACEGGGDVDGGDGDGGDGDDCGDGESDGDGNRYLPSFFGVWLVNCRSSVRAGRSRPTLVYSTRDSTLWLSILTN